MTSVTRDEFEARIEAVEARMDARIAAAIARLDAFEVRAEEREQRLLTMFAERDKRLDERDKRFDERFNERDKRLDERDKRLELLYQQAAAAAQSASTLKAHMWLATSTVVLAVVGTVVGAYYATQSSHLGMAQAVISAFQQGQANAGAVHQAVGCRASNKKPASALTDAGSLIWSGREDLNLRPPAPHAGTLPGCATPRKHESITDPLTV